MAAENCCAVKGILSNITLARSTVLSMVCLLAPVPLPLLAQDLSPQYVDQGTNAYSSIVYTTSPQENPIHTTPLWHDNINGYQTGPCRLFTNNNPYQDLNVPIKYLDEYLSWDPLIGAEANGITPTVQPCCQPYNANCFQTWLPDNGSNYQPKNTSTVYQILALTAAGSSDKNIYNSSCYIPVQNPNNYSTEKFYYSESVNFDCESNTITLLNQNNRIKTLDGKWHPNKKSCCTTGAKQVFQIPADASTTAPWLIYDACGNNYLPNTTLLSPLADADLPAPINPCPP